MSATQIGLAETTYLINKLSTLVDFKKDLPLNLFKGETYKFWFFERPLLGYTDLVQGLALRSYIDYETDLLVKFSGSEIAENLLYCVDREKSEAKIEWLSRNSLDFFCGKVGYPIVLFNRSFDWVAFESAFEEFGVIAVKEAASESGFCKYLNQEFISFDDFLSLAKGTNSEGLMAKEFLKYYG